MMRVTEKEMKLGEEVESIVKKTVKENGFKTHSLLSSAMC